MAVSGFLDSHFLLMYNIKIIPLWEIMPVLRGFYMKHTYSLPLRFLALVLALALMLPMAPTVRAAGKVYYPIDMTEAVLASRVTQRVSGGCAVASMATVVYIINTFFYWH